MPIKRKTSHPGALNSPKRTRIDAGPFDAMQSQLEHVHLEIPYPKGTGLQPPASLSSSISSKASTSSTTLTSFSNSDEFSASDSDASSVSSTSSTTSDHLYHVFRNLTGTPEFTSTFPSISTANRGTLRAFLARNCWQDFHEPAAVLGDDNLLRINAKWPDGRAAGAWVVPQRFDEPAMKEARTGEVWVLRREDQEDQVYGSEAGAVKAVKKLATSEAEWSGRCNVVREEGVIIVKTAGFGAPREIARATRRTVRC